MPIALKRTSLPDDILPDPDVRYFVFSGGTAPHERLVVEPMCASG